ncbi:hypothetical protein CI610_03657 [invertebrate metagenome]|uniref:Cytochrome P450 n=1 Tax=invertebrate metagenome TaxID=1711999 RepID=A0A2H9T2H2_9ZZZZ
MNRLYLLHLYIVLLILNVFSPISYSLLIDAVSLPSPSGYRFPIYHASELGKPKFHKKIEEWVVELETDVVYVKFPIFKHGIVIANGDIIDEVLKARPEKFRRSSKIEVIFSELNINGAFSSEGDDWRSNRRVITEGVKGIDSKLIEPISQRLVDFISQSIDQDQDEFLLPELFNRYTTEVVSVVVFDFDPMYLQLGTLPDLSEKLLRILPLANKRISSVIPTHKIFSDGLSEIVLEVNGLLRNKIRSLRQLDENNKFLERCIKQEMDESHIIANAFTLFVAAQDTTALTMSWGLKYILEYGCLDNLRLLSGEDFKQQFDRLILESMKKNPVAPIIYLEANEKYTTEAKNDNGQNITIDKGMQLILYTGNCKDKKMKSSKFNKHRNFGGGMRICPGMNIAMDEICIGLKQLITHFNIEVINPGDEEGIFDFLVSPGDLRVKFSKIP